MSTTTKQAPNRASVTVAGDRDVRVERVFHASRDRVWRAYTEPALVAQWWGRGHRMTIERMELERGGHWRYVEHAADGTNHGFEGRYREVKRPERIERTFEWDGMPGHVMVETSTFEDLGDGRTRVVITLLFHTRDDRDGMVGMDMEGGMNQSFAALDRLLATL